ncbi:hypothetical protein DE146DRAFT_650934 [Phaeosphaeria sp. MPI-PUGE-AT-0046c]|nr:hypothetical protein DE146DRAFT_650934 [Phaeosphaeria sp. MPI-PUGE-AT-0046c]
MRMCITAQDLDRARAAAGAAGLSFSADASAALGAVVVVVDDDGGGLHFGCMIWSLVLIWVDLYVKLWLVTASLSFGGVSGVDIWRSCRVRQLPLG